MDDRVSVPEQQVRDELARVLSAPEFARSPRLSRFLQVIVEEELAGRGDQLKEYSVGIQVFDRRDTFNPKADSTVRTQAHKLRDKLRQYYLQAGATDPVVIHMPTGGYVPEFQVRPVPAAPAVPAAVVQTPLAPSKPASLRTRKLIVWGAFLVLALAAGMIARFFGAAVRAVVPLTSDAGWELMPRFSPDGKSVVFAYNETRGPEFNIYVQEIATGRRRQLTSGAESTARPAWSPDGNWIAAIRGHSQEARVVLLPANGGSETLVPETTGAQWLDWNPATGELGIALPTDRRFGVVAYDPRSGIQRPLTEAPSGSRGDSQFAFSPDGDRLAIVRDGSAQDVYVVTLATGNMERVTDGGNEVHGLDWLSDNGLVLALQNDTGTRLWRATRLPLWGYYLRPLTASTAASLRPSVSPAGGTVVFESYASDLNLYTADIGSKSGAAPLQTSTWPDRDPQFSPDGKWLAFQSARSGKPEIWVGARDGSQTRQLTTLRSYDAGSPRWSPDGRSIAFDVRKLLWVVQIVDVHSGQVRRLTDGWHDESRPSWSADGKTVYFHSTRTGRHEIWKRPAAGGAAVRMTRNGGMEPFESLDGKMLYFIRQGVGLWGVPTAGGPERLIHRDIVEGRWQPGEAGIYFVQAQVPRHLVSLHLLDRISGVTKLIHYTPTDALISFDAPVFTITRDGRTIAFTQYDHHRHDLHLLMD